MLKQNEYLLTSKELCVLSALLGYKKVIGVNHSDSLVSTNLIPSIVKELESKNLICLEFGGTLKIVAALKCIIDIVCSPTRFLVIDIKQKSENSRVYFCKRNKQIVSLQMVGNDIYILSLLDKNFRVESFLKGIAVNSSDAQQGKISLSEIKKLRRISNRELTNNNDNQDFVGKFAKQKYDLFSSSLYQKSSYGYTCCYNKTIYYDSNSSYAVSFAEGIMQYKSLTDEDKHILEQDIADNFLRGKKV